MVTVPEIFKATANDFGDMMLGGSGVVSYRIPEYQRPYDWDNDNILRLMHDCLTGLRRLGNQESRHHYTFLGTIILASDSNQESSFDGKSLLVVDGQQRLTTLMLLSCAMFREITDAKSDIEKVSDSKVKAWLQEECEEQLNRLYGCTTGQRHGLSATTPFPRLVRNDDIRGHSFRDTQYVSGVASFLHDFAEYCTNEERTEFPFVESQYDPYISDVYREIGKRIKNAVYSGESSSDSDDNDFDLPVVPMSKFDRSGYRALFAKLDSVGTDADRNRVASYIVTSSEAEGLIRLLLFASYLVQSVVIAVVEAPDEDIAFDIFDALNTTGEPLTALDTLKPHVVRFEQGLSIEYRGSESARWWNVLEDNVINANYTPDQRQRESKELVTGFASYYRGEKIGADLAIQRNILRNYFTQARNRGDDVARGLIRSLAEMSQFRADYWDKPHIDTLVGPANYSAEYDQMKLCLRFIADTNTSTVIPILTRYWVEFREMDPDQNFLNSLKAATAFLALRRAMTGGTQRIDSDFRRIMAGDRTSTGRPLCLGTSLSNRILSIEELKGEFRAMLMAQPFRVDSKDAWLSLAREIPLANQASRVVCRFLLLAAAHNARPNNDHPGLMESEGIIHSDELKYLSFSTWTDQRHATIEHVAPDNPSGEWDASIYERQNTRHTIGNIVLLPERENQSIGNSPWSKKRLFYRALMAKTKDAREAAIETAEKEGWKFSRRTLDVIRNQGRLPMLDALVTVDNWTAQMIEERTENILSLAWEQIAPWLFE